MKNFPHQINQIPRLVQALEVFRALIDQGHDIDDDGVVGDALARASVYTFREREMSIEELLVIEHNKPRGSQGTRTCARELRRLFHLLGFLAENNVLNHNALRLIELQDDPNGFEARSIWSTSLITMELSDASGLSHPYQILLRLVRENPGIQGSLLGLCLEAVDDSEEEFQRINQLSDHSDPDVMWDEIEVSEHKARNSVKILPALARQLEDIIERESGYYLGYPSGATAENEPVESTSSRAINRRRRYDPNSTHEESPSDEYEDGRITSRAYDPDLVGRRLRAHQECLRSFSEFIPDGLDLYEDVYDLLVVADNNILLVEVKTIRNDEAKQIRLSLGQVFYYEHIVIDPMYPDHDVYRLVVTDSEPRPDLVGLLERHQIGVAWIPRETPPEKSTLANSIFQVFGITL